jgi:hypothetical protein
VGLIDCMWRCSSIQLKGGIFCGRNRGGQRDAIFGSWGLGANRAGLWIQLWLLHKKTKSTPPTPGSGT